MGQAARARRRRDSSADTSGYQCRILPPIAGKTLTWELAHSGTVMHSMPRTTDQKAGGSNPFERAEVRGHLIDLLSR